MDQNTFSILFYIVVGVFIIYKRYFSISAKLKILPAEAKKRMDEDKGIIVLDVRTKGEYEEKHIPNSISIPVNLLEKEAESKLPDKNAEIFVYCLSGSRSAAAVKKLVKLGYSNIRNLGGIIIWPYETVSPNR
jgi:rhodanese-related sulfurtransferase